MSQYKSNLPDCHILRSLGLESYVGGALPPLFTLHSLASTREHYLKDCSWGGKIVGIWVFRVKFSNHFSLLEKHWGQSGRHADWSLCYWQENKEVKTLQVTKCVPHEKELVIFPKKGSGCARKTKMPDRHWYIDNDSLLIYFTLVILT